MYWLPEQLQMRFRLLLLIILFCSQSLFAIQFKHLDSKDGLSQLSVLSIYQDKLGRMWFGTEEGVNIFDGYSIIPYKTFISNDDRNKQRKVFWHAVVQRPVGTMRRIHTHHYKERLVRIAHVALVLDVGHCFFCLMNGRPLFRLVLLTIGVPIVWDMWRRRSR